MRRRGRWGSPGGGAGPREVDARYFRGTWQVVPLEYSIERLTCAVASRLDAVMVG